MLLGRRIGLLGLAMWLALGLVQADEPPAAERPVILVMPKSGVHRFWVTYRAGATEAARELGVTLDWQPTETPFDKKAQQIQLRALTKAKSTASAMILALIDPTHDLDSATRQVQRMKIPLVTIDTVVPADATQKPPVNVATDQASIGALAARHLATLLPENGGEVLMLRYALGSDATSAREQGFLEALKTVAPEARVVNSSDYAGVNVAEAMKSSLMLLTKYPDVDAIFTSNATTTFGMLRALQTTRRAGKIPLVGCESSPALIAAVANGDVAGLVLEDPWSMGRMSVQAAVALMHGEPTAAAADPGVTLVTAANLEEPAIQKLVKPDLELKDTP